MKIKKFMTLIGVLMFVVSCSKSDLNVSPEKTTPNGESATKSSYTLKTWMNALNGSLKLSQLSIPGTHDAGARYEPLSGTAKCQNLTIAEQLSAGVRFLDIRCRHYNNTFEIHHGMIYQKINFDDVLNACWSFLSANPGECIIMSIKEEYSASGCTRTFEKTFDAYVAKNSSKWNLGTTIPTLTNARGKIVLLRRFTASSSKGINATAWSDNTSFTISNSSATIRVQDYYEVSDADVKWNNITGFLKEAKAGNANTLYINFSSGYRKYLLSYSITDLADVINPKLSSYFNTALVGRYGIIPMDFADTDRCTKIIKTNF